jgi:hypothetical protein
MNRTVPSMFAILGLALIATPAEARSHRARDVGTVEVMNRTSVPLTVSVESGGTRVLSPWETARFGALEGRRTVRATYEQFGMAQTLFATEVRVHEYRSVRLDARPPESGRIRVVNETGVRATVLDNGREVAELAPGTSRILTVPLGRNDVHVIAAGITVESEHLIVNAFDDDTVVGRVPRFADLVVKNPLPFAVDVQVDGRPSRRVSAYGSVVLDDVRTGRTEVTVRRTTGQVVDQSNVSVDPFRGGYMRVDVPNTGLVKLESADDDMLRVTLDGRLVATMAPFQQVTLALPVGAGFLEVREMDGRLVHRTMIEVDPLREVGVGFGEVERYDRGQHRRSEPEAVSCHDGDHTDAYGHEMARR